MLYYEILTNQFQWLKDIYNISISRLFICVDNTHCKRFRYTNHQKIFKMANLAMITVVDSAFWMAKEPRSYTAHLN